MINFENVFQKGKFRKCEPGTKLFSTGEIVSENAISIIKTGQVDLVIPKKDGAKISIPLGEGELIGVPEVYTGSKRVTEAVCRSQVECYSWNESEFLEALSIAWELSLYTIRSLASQLKIINSEFVEKIHINI
ncbi:MAG: cyclic nucleotide-binding domain-containing protein [Spirochaetes bacterium]|nr:cyclic nucleotide-binding domain-containing protein [Spirochaetota bacterium]